MAGHEAQPAVDPAKAELYLARAVSSSLTNHSGGAFMWSIEALAADPSSPKARERVLKHLSEHTWLRRELYLMNPSNLPVERIDFSPPHDLWVSLAGALNTTVRWNLETRKIESVLFPVREKDLQNFHIEGKTYQALSARPKPGAVSFSGISDGARTLVFDSQRRFLVIERDKVALLCDARTLKPIRDLGLLPDAVSPVPTIVFSKEGLLLAHPAQVSETDRNLVWCLRNTNTGEILRKSNPWQGAVPVAASLDRKQLRVLHADGTLMEMPVSPVETVRIVPATEPMEIRHAWFPDDHSAALARVESGPHCVPVIVEVPPGTSVLNPDPAVMLAKFPWNWQPNLWNGLMRESQPLRCFGSEVEFQFGNIAPASCVTTPTAVAMGGDLLITGDRSGTVILHRMLPRALRIKEPAAAPKADESTLAALRGLGRYLTGYRCDPEKGHLSLDTYGPDEKRGQCDFEALAELLPELDFSPLLAAMKDAGPDETDADATALLTDRLARAASPPDMADLVKIFDEGDDAAVKQAIRAAGGKGARAAKALELALASTKPEWIDACLSQAEDLPPLLRKLAASRVAWLQDRKADAIAGWPDVFPDLAFVRVREDWDGWEQADFSQALEKLKLCVGEELAAIAVPENATPEQRKAVFERLMDPQTVVAVGKPRYARACLEAALAFSAIKEEKETTFQLATIARNLGEAPAPCLRAEAMALTALGDYQEARERWIKLITEHPLAVQQPGDYAEAAYTSFENADPRQAMNILTTGMHRFPNDANFALRAGWVSLLTGNAERAYRFLLTGRQIGYPDEKLENATALLAIAAVQTGVFEDAEVFYQDLIALDPAWENPETIETLEWPEELKASLRQLVW